MRAWLIVGLAGCQGTRLSEEALRDPQACAECHPDHVREWSGSMHAFASADPVFRALNAKGQEETGGELGDFCVQCHAPVALELGLTEDGLNLDEVPESAQGVTCWFCHQVDGVQDDHNNPLTLALDRVLRGGIADPVSSRAHPSAYSALHDRDEAASSDLCGSCHDIVTPLGAHIERTYAEWQQSLFSDPQVGLNCSDCHMRGRDGVAAEVEGVPLRRVHDHRFPGVDLATIPWPEREDQRRAVQDFLDDSLLASLCVQPSGGSTTPVIVSLDNVAAGHSFPSGATMDRRVWVELTAFSGTERVWASGAVGEEQSVKAYLEAEPDAAPWTIYNTLFDTGGEPTHFFWEAASIDYAEGGLLEAHNTLDPTDPDFVQTAQSRNFLVRGEGIDRIEMRVRMRPLPLDLVDELIEEGWLDPAVKAELPTFTLASTVLEWTPDVPVNSGNLSCVPEPLPTPGR